MISQLNNESLKGSIEECFGGIPDSRIQLTLKSNHPTLAKEAQDWLKKHQAQPDLE